MASFPTTTEAMRLQAAASDAGLAGRLIPIPRQLSAGCGLAWSEPAANEALLRRTLDGQGIEFEQVCVLEL